MFELDYFGKRAYLAQTKQLYLETKVPKYKKVWCIGSSFRAESKVDNRHLTEFTLLELELEADFDKLLKEIERLFKYCLVDSKVYFPFERITYEEAINKFNLEWGEDLNSKHEEILSRDNPVFITHYPIEIKFFNMRVNDYNSKVVNSADLLFPYSGEAVGAAEREYKYEKLKDRLVTSQMYKQLEKKSGKIEDFNWFLDFYRNNDVKLHSGCGIGVNRIIQFLLKSNSILDTSCYPLNSKTLY